MRDPILHVLIRVLGFTALLSVLSLGLSACASTPDTTAPTEASKFGAVRLQLKDFRNNQPGLGLTNEFSVNRVEYNSSLQANVSNKIASDEIINVLVETFEAEDFWTYARPGQPPSGNRRPMEGGEELHAFIYMSTGERDGWITFRRGLGKDELESFSICTKAFVAVYNSVAGFQLIDNPEGQALFDKQKVKQP
jgi:hypothetical protein